MKIEFATIIAALPLLSGAYLWDADRREESYVEMHDTITADASRRANTAELERVELEIKMLVEWSTRRQLSESEQDRLEFLRSMRVLLKQQLGEK